MLRPLWSGVISVSHRFKKKEKNRRHWPIRSGIRKVFSVYIYIYICVIFFFCWRIIILYFFLSISLHFSTPHTRAYDTCTDLHGPARCSLLQCGGRLTGLLLGLYRDTQIFRLINLLSSNAARFRSLRSHEPSLDDIFTIFLFILLLSFKLALVYENAFANRVISKNSGEENILISPVAS